MMKTAQKITIVCYFPETGCFIPPAEVWLRAEGGVKIHEDSISVGWFFKDQSTLEIWDAFCQAS